MPGFPSRVGRTVAACLLLVVAPAAAATTPDSSDHEARLDLATRVTDTHVVRVDRRVALVATAPARVEAGRAVVVRGRVQVRAGNRARKRPVVVAERRAGAWRVVRRTTSRRLGDFRVAVPGTATAGTRVLEVRAPRSAGLRAAQARVRVTVVRTAVPETGVPPRPEEPGAWQEAGVTADPAPPLGDPGDWGYTFEQGGARWNPCRPIAWSYDPEGGYAGALDHVRTALDAIAARTGLTFAETTAADAAVTLRWSDAARDEALGGGVVGVARTRATATSGAEVTWRITSVAITLDRAHTLRQGHFDSGSPSWGQVITHELLHGLGLAHARGREQVMYPSVSSLNHRFGAGDLTGMVRVGAAGGCLT